MSFLLEKRNFQPAMLDYRSVNIFHNENISKANHLNPTNSEKKSSSSAELRANSPKSCVRCHRASPQKIRNQPAWPVVSEASPKTAPERAGFG